MWDSVCFDSVLGALGGDLDLISHPARCLRMFLFHLKSATFGSSRRSLIHVGKGSTAGFVAEDLQDYAFLIFLFSFTSPLPLFVFTFLTTISFSCLACTSLVVPVLFLLPGLPVFLELSMWDTRMSRRYVTKI